MSYKILVIDDNPDYLDILAQVLLNEGFIVVVAKSGQEGLELLETSGPFRVVICDWMMPGMDGCEVCSLVQQSSQLPEEFIFLTAYKKADTNIEYPNCRVRWFSKPTSIPEIKAFMQTLKAGEKV